MSFKIAIIGAGPAGCLLARMLTHQNSGISVTIFEGEAGIDFRSQGGTLDLHEKTGLRGLREAGLFEEFERYARYDGEALRLADKNMLYYVNLGQSASTGRPEIDRPKLRQLLFESLPKDTVKWQHKLSHVDEDLALHFVNQPSQKGFDLLVGADGAWSKTRTLLNDTKPSFSGIGGYAFNIPDAKNTQPELTELVNRGSLFAWSDGKSIMAQQMGDGSLNVYTWATHTQDWQRECGYDVHNAEAVKEACRVEYESWDPRLRAFIENAEDKVTPRDLFMLPVGFSWQHKTGVTLIGDASHLMTPFAGEGVNLAFADCIDFAASILKSESTTELDNNVKFFEQTMFARSTATMKLTYDNLTAMFLMPNSPRSNIESYVLRNVGSDMTWWTRMLLAPIVYAYFTVFKCIW